MLPDLGRSGICSPPREARPRLCRLMRCAASWLASLQKPSSTALLGAAESGPCSPQPPFVRLPTCLTSAAAALLLLLLLLLPAAGRELVLKFAKPDTWFAESNAISAWRGWHVVSAAAWQFEAVRL